MTLFVNFIKNNASSIAVSPPPTTTTSFPLKKKPSHVAHDETPLPLNLCSDSNPSHTAEAPVAIITESAKYSSILLSELEHLTRNGFDEKSTDEIALSTNRVPNR